MVDAFQHYLEDVLREVIDRAREANALAGVAEPSSNSADREFARGRALAYYEVVSHLVGQLDAFQIGRGAVGLDPSFDVDRDLVLRRASGG